MITVVGSLNLDLFIDTPRLPRPGETLLGHSFRQAPGGKGANQACAVGRLGHAVALLGAIGTDRFGDALLEALAASHVETGSILRRANTSSGTAFILVDAKGQNEIVVVPGANATLTPSDVDAQAPLFQGTRAVIAQLEIPPETARAALAAGRHAGAITLLNPAPAPAAATELPPDLLALCDWILPNETEATQLSGQTLNRPEDAPVFAKALRHRAPQAGILITLGPHGAWLDPGPQHPASRPQLIPAFPVRAIDTVGAGDAFVGAFAVRLVEGAAPAEAARFAAAAAALAVTRPGAQAGLPNRAEVEQLLAR